MFYADDVEANDPHLAIFYDPSVGVERVLSDTHGHCVIEPRPLASPTLGHQQLSPDIVLHASLATRGVRYAPRRGAPLRNKNSAERGRVILLIVEYCWFIRSSVDQEDDQIGLALRVRQSKFKFPSVVQANSAWRLQPASHVS